MRLNQPARFYPGSSGYTGDERGGGSSLSGSSSVPCEADVSHGSQREQLQLLREECDALKAKLETIAQIIGAADSSKIVHDVRNVMNELVLLRKLAELDE